MPKFVVRKANQVPAPDRTSKAVQEQRRIYDKFIKDIGSDIGELELAPDETVRRVKVGLARSATRQGVTIESWDADGKVYFKRTTRRGRPRKVK